MRWRQEVVEQVGKLKFPIDSKRDLVRKLGPGTRLAVAGATSETVATFFPASYYPLTSVDNFAEKLAEFYHHRRDVRPRIRPCTAAEVKARVDRLFKEQPELIEAAARLFLEVTRPSR